MTTDLGSEVTILDESACWQLLRSTTVGRLAVSTEDSPEIFPINFVVDQGTIVFRTGTGSKLAAVLADPNVTFEADGYESEAGQAWSVVAKGRAAEIRQLHELVDASTFPLFPWPAGPKNRFVRVVPHDVSGRRFHVVDSASWCTELTDVPRAAME